MSITDDHKALHQWWLSVLQEWSLLKTAWPALHLPSDMLQNCKRRRGSLLFFNMRPMRLSLIPWALNFTCPRYAWTSAHEVCLNFGTLLSSKSIMQNKKGNIGRLIMTALYLTYSLLLPDFETTSERLEVREMLPQRNSGDDEETENKTT